MSWNSRWPSAPPAFVLESTWERAMARPPWNPKKSKKKPTCFCLVANGTLTTTIATNAISPNNKISDGNDNSGGSEHVTRFCKEGRLKDALHIFHFMDRQGLRPHSSTYASLLQECINEKSLSGGKLIHAHMIHSGFNPESFLQTKLVIMYAKCGSLPDARQLLDRMPQRNVISWNATIAAYAKHGRDEEALALYYRMQREGIKPNKFTFPGVLPACANLASLKHAKEVHEDIVRSGFQSDIFVGSALIKLYAKCGNIEIARQLFDAMSERDIVSWNAMFAGYAENGQVGEALELFQKMPDRNVVSWNAMIAGYAQNGLVDEALKLFQKMSERNVVSWTTMITGYVQSEQTEEALKLFQKMPDRDAVSWNAIVAVLAQNGHVEEAVKHFQGMPEPDMVSWNALISGYAQNRYVDDALRLFQKMPERNEISWTGMIAGYAQNGNVNEALNLFQQMQLTGMKPDSLTFTSVLPACANLAALKSGTEVHGNIIRNGFWSHILVGNALIDMYAKCGSIEDAINVFDKMPERNIVSWNAMIVGYAKHGCGKEALQLFEQMQCSDTKPNHVTFIGILSACSHAGLVDDGWQYFDRMSQDFKITPAVEHYCCMVDLLGRAGHLDEAQDFITKMPIKPNIDLWGSLLAACRIHGNIELGEQVAECLFELDPENAAFYVLLSNIYAAAGRWNAVERVRKMMKDRKVKKIPGCSWIEVNGKVYSFLVSDSSHPQMQQIHAELQTLSQKMKEAGYMPDTSLVLHDVEERQKEHILCHHSEKLAIAFGLIHVSSGTPIRIVKNLRVCGDCHSATKFISKIAAREIIVRDISRFHHFKDGLCSCGDYW